MKSMHISRRIAFNSGVLLAVRILTSLLSLLVSVSLARYLDASGYGKFSLVFAYLSFFQVLTGLGIDTIVIREVLRDPGRQPAILGNAILLKIACSILAFAVSVIVSRFMGYPGDVTVLILFASFSLLLSFNTIYVAAFQAQLKAVFYSLPELLITAFFSALMLLCISLGSSLPVLVLLQAATAIPMTIAYVYFAKRNLSISPSFRYDARICRLLLSESWPIFFSSVFVSINMRIDQIMLFKMVDARALGLYSSGVRLAESLNIIPVVFMASVYPLLCDNFTRAREMFLKMYSRSFKYMSLVILPISFGTTLLAERIILFFYGPSFVEASPSLAVLIWSEVFIFLGVVFSYVVTAAGLQRYLLSFTITGAASNVILNLFLIPRYGTLGAAVASLVSYGGLGLVLQWIYRDIRPIAVHYCSSLIKPTLCCIPMALLLLKYGKMNLFFLIPASAATYFLMVIVTGALNKEDRDYIKGIFFPPTQAVNEAPELP